MRRGVEVDGPQLFVPALAADRRFVQFVAQPIDIGFVQLNLEFEFSWRYHHIRSYIHLFAAQNLDATWCSVMLVVNAVALERVRSRIGKDKPSQPAVSTSGNPLSDLPALR